VTARARGAALILCLLVAAASVAGAVVLTYRSSPGAPRVAPPAVAVLSPRRAPQLLRELVASTRLSARVAAVVRTLSANTCMVVEVGDSEALAVRPDLSLAPASALKLTTAAAFLAEVGGKGRFTTTVKAPRPDSNGVVHGDLTIFGGGDPLLATPGYVATRRHPPTPATDFTKLVAAVRAAGIRHVTGGIAVNDALFDAERRVPSWSAGYTQTGDVGPLGALAVNDGFSSYTPRLVAAADPAMAAGDELRAELAADGVIVDGAIRRTNARASQVDGDPITVDSAPFADVVGEMLRESDNNTAELLLKQLAVHEGAAGTRAAGVDKRKAALRKLGVDSNGISAIDGSGLERSDRATCHALLSTLTTKPGGYDVETMLATAGRTGTLNDRFNASPLAGKLRAKTGSLDGVTALVGVADESAPTKVHFAFVSNGSFTDAGGKALQDRVVAALATYPEAPDAATLAP
jgi:D-alanyl-D-alanine carboxypeptidase/D-alanyl-D-alanine-endopeptidase (penicillin-binding protein 4)